MRLRDDRTKLEHVPFESTPWVPSPQAHVDRKMLERDGGEVARATSIVRYGRGSSFPEHTHAMGEEFVVLDGVFSDDRGDYGAGTYVRNPPGSSHRPFSVDGCTIFVKLRQIAADDARHAVIRPDDGAWLPENGVSTRPLHAFGTERVSFVRIGEGTTCALGDVDSVGVELVVLRGSLHIGAMRSDAWTWLRAPSALDRVRALTDCEVWLKQGICAPELRAASIAAGEPPAAITRAAATPHEFVASCRRSSRVSTSGPADQRGSAVKTSSSDDAVMARVSHR